MIPRPKISPCADCKDRHEGCHSECERYEEWRKIAVAYSHAKSDYYNDAFMGFAHEMNRKRERIKNRRK